MVLSGYLGMTEAELMPLLTKPNTHFVYIKKKVPALTYSALAADLAKRGIYGVFRESDPIRTYPDGAVGSSVVGFVGADGKGQAGLELSFNRELAGVEGKETYESAPNGSKIPLGQSSVTPAQNGIGYPADHRLRGAVGGGAAAGRAVRKTDADWGFAITLDVKTGQVLAMAQRADLRLVRTRGQQDGGSRQPGGQRPVRAGQRGEGAHLRRADRLRRRPRRTTRVMVPNRLRLGRRLRSRTTSSTSELQLQHARSGRRTPPTSGPRCSPGSWPSRSCTTTWSASVSGSRPGSSCRASRRASCRAADMPDGQRDQVAFGQALVGDRRSRRRRRSPASSTTASTTRRR